jgi:hypothetical protein
MPSLTRFGVTVIGLLYRALLVVPLGSFCHPVSGRPSAADPAIPAADPFTRTAYVWEHWPDTLPTGASR